MFRNKMLMCAKTIAILLVQVTAKHRTFLGKLESLSLLKNSLVLYRAKFSDLKAF